MKRFPLDAGVRLPRTFSADGDSAMEVLDLLFLLGVAAILPSILDSTARDFDGVAEDTVSNRLRI